VRPGTVSDFVSAATDQRFDVVYVDPPYAVKNAVIEELLERVGDSLLAERGLIVIERSARDGVPQVPDRLNLVSEKNYGETKLIFLEHSSSLP
jgi:16S rRNA (guanine966-N2)-methyltransferase